MSAARRLVLISLAAAAAATVITWMRRRNESAAITEPPQWPPFDEVAPSAPMTTWMIATGGDEAPDGFAVKVKVSSGIFHVPGGRFYDRTTPDRWYATAEAASADGYRQSKT